MALRNILRPKWKGLINYQRRLCLKSMIKHTENIDAFNHSFFIDTKWFIVLLTFGYTNPKTILLTYKCQLNKIKESKGYLLTLLNCLKYKRFTSSAGRKDIENVSILYSTVKVKFSNPFIFAT